MKPNRCISSARVARSGGPAGARRVIAVDPGLDLPPIGQVDGALALEMGEIFVKRPEGLAPRIRQLGDPAALVRFAHARLRACLVALRLATGLRGAGRGREDGQRDRY